MIDDHDRCEWVNVFSSTGSPGFVPDKVQTAVKWLCVCVCVPYSHYNQLFVDFNLPYLHLVPPLSSEN